MPSSVASRSNRSVSVPRSRDGLNESDVQRLQREVDNFTRKLEQEKRRLFTVEETHIATQKEYREKAKKVDTLKPVVSLEKKNMSAKMKGLEHQFDQLILKFNETVAANENLRSDIDVIRRERVTYNKVKHTMSEEVEKIARGAKEHEEKSKASDDAIKKIREKIVGLRGWNENEHSTYLSEFDKLQRKYKDEKDRKKIETKDRNQKQKDKIENLLDTQLILKRRLQRIILNNKEKVKVVEQYMKNMKVIDEAFNIIKETSGITDIEEIMNTFIKSEEQNYSLFNYVNVLTQDIDFLEENNKDLSVEIELLDKELDQKQKAMEKTPEEEIEKQKVQEAICEKELYISDVRNQLYRMRDPLEGVLRRLAETKFCSISNLVIMENFILNEQTIDYYLSIFEAMINKLIPYISKKNNNKNFMTSALLFEELNVKQLKKQGYEIPNVKDLTFTEESTLDQTPFLEEDDLKNLALGVLDKYRERSMNNGYQSVGKQTKEASFL